MNGMLLTGDATPHALSPETQSKNRGGPGALCRRKHTTSGHIIDLSGWCNLRPLRKDEIHAQLLQLQHWRTFPIEIKAPRLRFGRGAYTFPREYFSNKRVLQLNEREPTNENLAYLNAGCVVQRGPFFYRVLC